MVKQVEGGDQLFGRDPDGRVVDPDLIDGGLRSKQFATVLDLLGYGEIDSILDEGGAGTNTPTRQQVKDLQTFTEKRMEQDARRKEAEERGEEFDEEPYVHPNITQREINDETLDEAMDYLKDKLGPEKFDELVLFLSKGGAVHTHLTKLGKLKRGEPGYDPESPGYKRVD